MEGNPQIIELLNDVLTAELTAVNQYFIHAKMCENWGFGKLGEYVKAESIDEMRHAEALIDRILYFEGVPNLQRLLPLNVGENVPEQFRNDLQVEYAAVERLNAGITAATEVGDNGTRALLESILTAEEEHVDWLETQIDVIGTIGESAYLAEQL